MVSEIGKHMYTYRHDFQKKNTKGLYLNISIKILMKNRLYISLIFYIADTQTDLSEYYNISVRG